jgi:hypothetical protein
MCYSEFNDILPSVAAMDADVVTIETSRSRMELLNAFRTFKYPNDIGPGVYDIHSPRVPAVEEIVALLDRAVEVVPVDRLWVQSGLRSKDTRLGGNRNRASKHGDCGAQDANQARELRYMRCAVDCAASHLPDTRH